MTFCITGRLNAQRFMSTLLNLGNQINGKCDMDGTVSRRLRLLIILAAVLAAHDKGNSKNKMFDVERINVPNLSS